MAYYQSKPTSGRHFLQIPGPSNTPDRVLRAMDNPTMDHRGPDFGRFGKQLLEKLRGVFKTSQPVIVFPASGTGAWEAALANTLSPGDRVLMCETGWFAHLWQELAGKLGLTPELSETDWRRGADVAAIEASPLMVSTSSSAGWPAASIALRTAAMREVAPVLVSLCTTQTALMACALSAASRASIPA